MANSMLNAPFQDLSSCNLSKCKSVKRLRQILHFMQCIEENDDENKHEIQKLLIEYIEDNEYNHIINDYHHIIKKHLNNKDQTKNDKNYQLINNTMTKMIQCDINKCNSYKRNGTDREKNTKNNVKGDNKNESDKKGAVIMELLDTVHTHFVHSFDIGYRMRIKMDNDYKNEDDDENFNDLDNLDNLNSKMKSLKLSITDKRKKMENIRGKNNMKHNKFITNFKMDADDNKNEIDKKSPDNDMKNETDKKEEEKIETANNFSFGIKFYYWQFYKNNDCEDKIFHPGDSYSKWYINPKYNNLKTEVLNIIDIDLYNDTATRAEYLFNNSITLKNTKSRNGEFDKNLSKRYGDIPIGIPISIENLFSLIFYSDFTNLSYLFSLSFRNKSFNESIESVKERNAEFWHWSKLLNETVSLYGNRLNYNDEPAISVLYHGISYMYFDSFITRFISPTSTTRQLSVAMIFASTSNNGIILSIEQKGGMEQMYPYYFDMSLISRFGNEDERLFIGGNGDAEWGREGLLEFRSITLVRENKDLKWYVRALSLFSIVINGQGYFDDDKYVKSVKWYFKFICNLLKGLKVNETDLKYPKYIKVCLQKLLDKREYVKINLYGMSNFYPEFQPLFLSKTVSTLVNVEYICNIFKNVEKIVMYMHYEKITLLFIKELIKMLLKIDKTGTIKLKEIVFESYGFESLGFENVINLKICKLLFDEQDWKNWKWKVNHLDTFTGVGSWNQQCNGLQIISQHSKHQ